MANVTVQRMTPERARRIQLMVDGAGFGILGLIGLLTGVVVSTGFFAALFGLLAGCTIWAGIRLGNDLRVVQKQQFLVVERFGEFHRVYHDGLQLLLLVGIIDRIKSEDTLAYQAFEVYTGDAGAAIDFKDASAPVTAVTWFAIGDPKKKEKMVADDWAEIDEDIIQWTYAYEKVRQRIQEIVDGFVRPRLQNLTLDEAQVEKDKGGDKKEKGLGDELRTDRTVKAALKELGAYFDPKKALIISDIQIPDDLVKERARRLIALATANADEALAEGFKNSIKTIKDAVPGVSEEDVLQAVLTRLGYDTVQKLNVKDLQLIASDVGGVVRTLQVGNQSQGGSA